MSHCFWNIVSGPADTLEFQAETRKLLDIVARSLYSEKEVGVNIMRMTS